VLFLAPKRFTRFGHVMSVLLPSIIPLSRQYCPFLSSPIWVLLPLIYSLYGPYYHHYSLSKLYCSSAFLYPSTICSPYDKTSPAWSILLCYWLLHLIYFLYFKTAHLLIYVRYDLTFLSCIIDNAFCRKLHIGKSHCNDSVAL
jgi:hypothetical protein